MVKRNMKTKLSKTKQHLKNTSRFFPFVITFYKSFFHLIEAKYQEKRPYDPS